MNNVNKIRDISFSGPHIEAKIIENVKDFQINERTIVVNPTMDNVTIDEQPQKAINSLNSVILKNAKIKSADLIVSLTVKDEINIGNIILEPGWNLLGDTMGLSKKTIVSNSKEYPWNTPLWKSSQDDVKTVTFDPYFRLGQRDKPEKAQEFLIKVNLWFSPGKTNCFIHNMHDFIEVHTQVYGLGRMQKFTEQDYDSLYEDIIMSPGYTTPEPFCNVNDNNLKFTYPWHQYYADTDCIWMAIEFHPVK